MPNARRFLLAVALLVASAAPALTQTLDPADGWRFAIYPVFAWVPLSIDINVDVPDDGGLDGGGVDIVDSRLEGAFFGGFEATNGRFRIEGDGLWAGVGGDRPDRPFLTVDVDAFYWHAALGVRVVNDLYLTGGVRRIALKYNIQLGDLEPFERKPGIWDPVVGLAWHSYPNDHFEFHASAEYGGFGVGTEEEFVGTVRLDLKPWEHFGFTAGYSLQHYRLENERLNKVFGVKQTMHGPVVGIGLYF